MDGMLHSQVIEAEYFWRAADGIMQTAFVKFGTTRKDFKPAFSWDDRFIFFLAYLMDIIFRNHL